MPISSHMTSHDTTQSHCCHHSPSFFSEASSSFRILSRSSLCLVSTTGLAGGGSSGGGSFDPFPDDLLAFSFLAGTGVCMQTQHTSTQALSYELNQKHTVHTASGG